MGNTPTSGVSPATLPPSPGAHPQLQGVLVVGAGGEIGVDTGPAAEGAGVGWDSLLQLPAVPGIARAGKVAACREEGVRMRPAGDAGPVSRRGRPHRWTSGVRGLGARPPPPAPGTTGAPCHGSALPCCWLGTGGMGTPPPPPLPAGGTGVRPREGELSPAHLSVSPQPRSPSPRPALSRPSCPSCGSWCGR